MVDASTSCGAPRMRRCPSPVRARSHGVVSVEVEASIHRLRLDGRHDAAQSHRARGRIERPRDTLTDDTRAGRPHRHATAARHVDHKVGGLRVPLRIALNPHFDALASWSAKEQSGIPRHLAAHDDRIAVPRDETNRPGRDVEVDRHGGVHAVGLEYRTVGGALAGRRPSNQGDGDEQSSHITPCSPRV